MLAAYQVVDGKTLNSMKNLGSDELSNRLSEIEEDNESEMIDIDKIWDALHCFLTGVSATHPIEGNKLSEAVVGIHFFNDDEDGDFITYIKNEELQEIISSLEKIDVQNVGLSFDMMQLQKEKISPDGIWKEDKQLFLDEMQQAIDDILDIYKSALKAKRHVIVSIL